VALIHISTGGYAVVYKGTWRGQRVAIKELKLHDPFSLGQGTYMAQRNAFEEFRHEVWIMRSFPFLLLWGVEVFC